jgi:hypothetical protein
MSRDVTEQTFLKDVAQHRMQVLRDDGVYRHVRFATPGTVNMSFELVTWPGRLCYAGDMGTFVFERLADMFQFFRKEERGGRSLFAGIDRRYWAEKVEAEYARGRGLREFDKEAFQREITRQRRKLLVHHARGWERDTRADFWQDLQSVIDAAEEDEHSAVTALRDWSFQPPTRLGRRLHLSTDDFPSCQRYTYHFEWCCYALAWGIHQYDAQRAATEQVAA